MGGPRDEDADSDAISELYRYYAQPNKDLYRLLEFMGPSSGWTGKFPDG